MLLFLFMMITSMNWITSDDITAGLYHQLTSSFTNYRVVSPGFQYYSQVSKGPVGNMYPV